MGNLYPPPLELATLAAFANTSVQDAESAIELLQNSPAFTDLDCLRIFETISGIVYAKGSNTTIEESKLLFELHLTGHGLEDAKLFKQAEKTLQSTPWLAGNPHQAAKVLLETRKREQAVRACQDAAGRIAVGGDPSSEISKAADTLAQLAMKSRKQKTKEDLAAETRKEIEDVFSGKKADGIDLGVPPPAEAASTLRKVLRLRPSKMYTIGALKKTGKSKFLLHTMYQGVARGVPCHFLSLEMTDRKVLEWWASTTAQIDSARIPSKSLSDEEKRRIDAAIDEYLQQPMHISYHPGATLNVVRHEARRLRMKYPDAEHALLGVDHIGLMQHDRDASNMALALEQTCTGLLRIAQEFEVSLLVLSQCPVSTEYQKEPRIQDLKWSGAIGECSEAILMLHNASRQGANEAEDPRKVKISMRVWQRDGRSNVRIPMLADMTTGRFFEVAA